MQRSWALNGHYVENKPQKLMPTIIEGLPDLQFRSTEALQHLYSELIELAIEMAEEERKEVSGTKRGVLTRYINSLRTRKKRQFPKDRVRMLTVIYDTVLAAEGMGLLPGFGFGNKYGDSIAGNPERQSIYNIEPQKGKREDITMSDEIKRSELVNAAKELNELLGLEPPIDPKDKPDVLKVQLGEAAALLEEEDEIAEETRIVLEYLANAEKSEPEEEEKEPEPEEEEVFTEETPSDSAEVDLLSLVKGAKKLADLKELVLEYDEFKKLRKGMDSYQGISGPRDLKAAMLKVLGNTGPAPGAPEKEEKKEKPAPAGKKATGSGDLMEFLTSQIQAGEFTREQIREAAAKRFPDLKMSTISTILSDGKNPKYSKFPVPYTVGEGGNLFFPGKKERKV